MAIPIKAVSTILDAGYDAVVVINDDIENFPSQLDTVKKALAEFLPVNPNLAKEVAVVPFPNHPSKRLIFTPCNPLNTDQADCRCVYQAAEAGIKKCIVLGCKNPVICCGSLRTAPCGQAWAERKYLLLNAVLGAYYALYTPIEVREMVPSKFPKANQLGMFEASQSILDMAVAMEEGRCVARDIGGSDPERMSAINIAAYIETNLKNLPNVEVRVEKVDAAKYPLMAAVNRAASVVPRHDGRVVHLEYNPSPNTQIDTSLFLIGKGITYDTGGADVKANGVMAGMHRDKCGAAAIAGLFRTIGLLQPAGLKVTASLAFVRNSIGSESYVADEIIISRAGRRIRIGNTDAEGRMVMADLLCEAKEKAVKAPNPFLFTIATLTGHVIRAYKDYTAVMDNGPARLKNVSQQLQKAGDLVSDMAEISTIRKEDYEAHKGPSEYEDVLQCNNLPSSATARGHQTPAAFLIMTSGINEHGLDSKSQLPYTHVDVAGSAAGIYTIPTAAPLSMFVSQYIFPRMKM